MLSTSVHSGGWRCSTLALRAAIGIAVCSLIACGEDAGTTTIERGSATPTTSSTAPSPPLALPPSYRVVHVFPKDTSIVGLGSAIVACSSFCDHREDEVVLPKTWLVIGETVTEDATLFPKDLPPSAYYWVDYDGSYPESVYAVAMVGREEHARAAAFRLTRRGPATS